MTNLLYRNRLLLLTATLILIAVVVVVYFKYTSSPSNSVRKIPSYTLYANQPVNHVVLSVDQQLIAASSLSTSDEPPFLFLWNFSDRSLIAKLQQPNDIRSIAISPDNKYVVVVFSDGNISAINTESRDFKSEIILPNLDQSHSDNNICPRFNLGDKYFSARVQFHPDPGNKTIAVSCRFGEVILLQVDTGQIVQVFPRTPSATENIEDPWVRNVAFSSTGNILAALRQDNSILVYDYESKKLLNEFHLSKDSLNGDMLTFCPPDTSILTSEVPGNVQILSLLENKLIVRLRQENSRQVLAVNSDCTIAAAVGVNVLPGVNPGATNDIYLQKIDQSSSTIVDGIILEGHSGAVMDVDFSQDKKWVVSGGEDGTVQIWQTN